MGLGPYRRAETKRLFTEQRGECYYCGEPMVLNSLSTSPRRATLDHIIPRSKGGVYSAAKNAVAACFECNNRRGDRDARMFLLEVRGML